MKKYELVLLFGKDNEAYIKDIESQIKKSDGTIDDHEKWGSRRLAYQIGDSKEGSYHTLMVSMPAAAVKPLKEKLDFDGETLRYLLRVL